jgi:hypothetical protein
MERTGVVEHANGAELNADWDGSTLPEDLAHLIRLSGRREIPIQVWMAENGVANRPSDAPCLVPSLLEPASDLEHGFGGAEVHGRGWRVEGEKR